MNLVVFCAVGAFAGWIAGQIMERRGFGILGNLVVGVLGALLGGFLFRHLGLTPKGLVGDLLMSVAGAVVLLFLVGLVRARK